MPDPSGYRHPEWIWIHPEEDRVSGTQEVALPIGKSTSKDVTQVKRGSYFILHVDTAPPTVDDIRKELRLDYDVVSVRMFERFDKMPPGYVCTLHEEMLPPPHRPSVQALVKEGRKRPKWTSQTVVNEGSHVDD